MNDEEFHELHDELEGIYRKLHYLQNIYHRETGRSFVFGQRYIPKTENLHEEEIIETNR